MATLGNSGIDVFPLSLGGNVFGWTSDKDASFEVLDQYVSGGGNFIDTADGYSAWVPGNSGGESETIIGEWLRSRGHRDQIVVATKVSQHPQFRGLSATTIAAAADASLGRLGVEHIDLYYAHYDDESTPLIETAAAFDALVRAGKVRAVAVSNYTGARIREWIEIARREGFALPVAVQPHYNLVARANYETDIAPVAAAENLAVVPYYGLASGFLTGKYRTTEDLSKSPRGGGAAALLENGGLDVVGALDKIARDRGAEIATVALAWLRQRPRVVAPIASASTTAQLPALLASATFDLSADEAAALDAASSKFA
ncbi:aldo/keto reductase [Paractinoplanes atraurantiacus]|uniref:Predicted oxidoreductase n=1 Tax=Paractinoplanes atraurantiacus TaxID=1036182 RepID=A0A285KPM7_9ACTN|nr:aldo/keto reductase [Actinoplanes atraurantiacus]SNY74575.1 Predicted oxidoreductase [Actinoplanes atraurantiacus]